MASGRPLQPPTTQEYLGVIINLQSEINGLVRKNAQLAFENRKLVLDYESLYLRNIELSDFLEVTKLQSELFKLTINSERKDFELFKMRINMQYYEAALVVAESHANSFQAATSPAPPEDPAPPTN